VGGIQTNLALVATVALSAFAFAPSAARGPLVVAALVCLGFSLASPASPVAVWCVLVAVALCGKVVGGVLDVWPLHLGIPLAAAALYSRCGPAPLPTSSWARPGSLEPGVQLLVVLVTVVSDGGLGVWLLTAAPQIVVAPSVRGMAPASLLVVGTVFALVNSGLEELIFRGVALDALRSVFRRRWLAVVLQAGAFGALHYASPSIPSGASGAVLTFLYGLALGALAVGADGVLAAWVAHFFADMIVVGIMAGGA
jgi:membrane protease YdiL (CAAX protease family)